MIGPGTNPEQTQSELNANKRIQQIAWIVIGSIVVFLLGMGSGYLRWGQDETAEVRQKEETASGFKWCMLISSPRVSSNRRPARSVVALISRYAIPSILIAESHPYTQIYL